MEFLYYKRRLFTISSSFRWLEAPVTQSGFGFDIANAFHWFW
jgi:hypothetical protein